MPSSISYASHHEAKFQWGQAREDLKKFRQTKDLDKFAEEYFKRYPANPPDPFDKIFWGSPNLDRRENRSPAKHIRANEAIAPTGVITRLIAMLDIPTFITPTLTALGFSESDASYKNYQDPMLIGEVKEALKELVTGSSWYSIEIRRSDGLIHPHILCEHDAFDFEAYTELIYETRGLYKYLIKGIPYNASNLAVWLKARKLLLEGIDGRKQLPRKTGTIRVPYLIA